MEFIRNEDSENEHKYYSFKEGSSREETQKIQLEKLRKHSYKGTYISPSKYEPKVWSSSIE